MLQYDKCNLTATTLDLKKSSMLQINVAPTVTITEIIVEPPLKNSTITTVLI